MTAITEVTYSTRDRDGLTLADLMQFIQQADAAGTDPRTPVHVRAGFRAQLKAITTGPTIPRIEASK